MAFDPLQDLQKIANGNEPDRIANFEDANVETNRMDATVDSMNGIVETIVDGAKGWGLEVFGKKDADLNKWKAAHPNEAAVLNENDLEAIGRTANQERLEMVAKDVVKKRMAKNSLEKLGGGLVTDLAYGLGSMVYHPEDLILAGVQSTVTMARAGLIAGGKVGGDGARENHDGESKNQRNHTGGVYSEG